LARRSIDTGNYFPLPDGTIPELEPQELTDSKMLQRHLAEAHVVKAFNNINYQHSGPCRGRWTRPTAPPCRSPATTRAQRSKPLSLLGYDSVDVGPLTESWRSQPGTPVFCAPYAVTKDDQYSTQPAAPASATEVGAALASARR
jgi:8-hydroxy-5-deazaflavin:NADPH oxidoreductase